MPRETDPARRLAMESTLVLWQQVQANDSMAVDELYRRYLPRLIALVRKRLSRPLSRRLDPEDVVQSAYRSFFAAAGQEKFVLERSGDLWRLLARITLNKLADQCAWHRAARRDVSIERSSAERETPRCEQPEAVSLEPSPEHVAAVAEEIRLLLENLDPVQGQMVEMRLNGYTIQDIAESCCRSERTVRRLFESLRARLQD
ncbi:MAG: RNA polymerase sigma factor [Pirellulaceae bacterium]